MDFFKSFLGIFGLIAGLSSAAASRKVGRIEQEAFREEAAAVQLQGAIAQEEAEVEAERVAEINRRFGEQQKVNFLKSGVTLAGSPLLVLAETAAESAKEVEAIRRRGRAQFGLASAKARVLRKRGKARLIGRTAEGLATGVSALTSFGDLGGFTGELFRGTPSRGGGGGGTLGGGGGGGGFIPRFSPTQSRVPGGGFGGLTSGGIRR